MSTARADALGNPASTPSDVLLALADRLEREEPSRELDTMVCLAINPEYSTKSPFGGFVSPGIVWRPNGAGDAAKYYTTSLDAAVTLVGDDWSLKVSAWHEGYLGGHAWLMAPSGPDMSDMTIWGEGHTVRGPNDRTYGAAHAAFPRAICAAALRARAAVLEASGKDGEDGGAT